MSDVNETIFLCHFTAEFRIGEPAIIVENDYGGPFDVKHGCEYTRPIPGKKHPVLSSRARLGNAHCSIHQGLLSASIWDLAENRDRALEKLSELVKQKLIGERNLFQASLDDFQIKTA